MIIVSACLCGDNCKYNGKNNENKKVKDFLSGKEFVKICPEELGGLSTPRNPAEIITSSKDVLNKNGKIISNEGKDVTKEFLNGAYKSLEIAKNNKAKKAILKAKSPSCGCGLIYDGTFNGVLIEGNGITAQLFLNNGIDVITEDMI